MDVDRSFVTVHLDYYPSGDVAQLKDGSLMVVLRPDQLDLIEQRFRQYGFQVMGADSTGDFQIIAMDDAHHVILSDADKDDIARRVVALLAAPDGGS